MMVNYGLQIHPAQTSLVLILRMKNLLNLEHLILQSQHMAIIVELSKHLSQDHIGLIQLIQER